ncbi:hypothetical protein PHLGIDRAFT_15638 [Phlebiopsis gigantea 11061_1 CR5-6]|uniref:Phosphoglycerate mutase family protein n=1 Tax=Phlebiopsis gigantea (strain 11061_1 CR5-6) TaxID=745531 RepID=A0A0C3RT62_PHLG1|nr:hypothetical protein PHLGIDRAFT_15638 [Phlebiopsis gigantea 11061_1 CR5-6]
MPSIATTLLLPALLLARHALPARADGEPFLNTVYLIRNAETNTAALGSGLSPAGRARAACLPRVFGPGGPMAVEYIIAEPPTADGNKTEALDTAAPLAAALGLTIDTSCGRDDKDCVGEALAAYALDHPRASMLVVWGAVKLPDIAEALGANNVPDWPAAWYDLIWTVQDTSIRAQSSEGCPGLDAPAAGGAL